MCAGEHSINYVNNFHYEMMTLSRKKCCRKAQGTKNTPKIYGQKDVLPINYKYLLHLKLGETMRNYYLYWEGR